MAENSLLDDTEWLVPIVAKSMFRRLSEIDYAAIYSDAMFGLMEAAERYDPEKSTVPFKVYAELRMRHRIIDGWRTRYGREVTSARRDRFRDLSLDYEYEYEDGTGQTSDFYDFIPDTADLIGQVDDRAECEWLLERLSARDAKILWDHYALGIPLATIGRREGVTESRIGQILDAGKKRLHDVASV